METSDLSLNEGQSYVLPGTAVDFKTEMATDRLKLVASIVLPGVPSLSLGAAPAVAMVAIHIDRAAAATLIEGIRKFGRAMRWSLPE